MTTHYYLGGCEVACRKGTTLQYLHQDHLGSTAVTTNTPGTVVAIIGYCPFGGTRYTSGTPGTDNKFTIQRLDQIGMKLSKTLLVNPIRADRCQRGDA